MIKCDVFPRMWGTAAWLALVTLAWSACGDDGAEPQPDAAPGFSATTAHCSYQEVPATAGAGGQVSTGPLQAGVAENRLDVPVGTTLGAYTGRANFFGGGVTVDGRDIPLSGVFSPSVGLETAPRVQALALRAGDETVVLMKVDIGLMYEALLFDLEERLGPSMRGKVLLSVSHSHSGWGQFSGHTGLMVGVGAFRQVVYEALLDQLQATAEQALGQLQPAALGVFVDRAFDLDNRITRDRRGENDELMGGPRKDDTLVVVRVDAQDGTPMAMVPIFGIHGTINDYDNILAATDATGGIERALEESFDSPVMVMHLQGAAGDVSPVGRGRLDCEQRPGNPNDPCFEWLRSEGLGHTARDTLMTAWQNAGQDMRTELELEMLTRSIELGPYAETFTIRDGALSYLPFDPLRLADGVIFDEDTGAILSPIDDFNAPVGAALCESTDPLLPNAGIFGTEGVVPYGSCLRVERAGEIFSLLLEFPFESGPTQPICQSTRTTVSALRLGDYLVGTLPGEVTVLAADLVRELSPVDPERTIVVGYSQGHIGYLLRPEDWLLGGYEPSIGFWGPLEAEYIIERLAELLPLAMTGEREDAAADGRDRVAALQRADDLAIDDPAPMAGTVPADVPDDVWMRAGTPASAQPEASVARVSGLARFVWIGDDPMVRTPRVTLERETAPGVFAPAMRRSGRTVTDGELVLAYTPLPLVRDGAQPQTHYWAVEWQPVPWQGADAADGAALDTLAMRAALPLGAYRFHVAGDGWQVTSEPFTVTPTDLGVSATRVDSTIAVTATVHAPQGYRLLDLVLPSNQPVPLANAQVTVELSTASGSLPEQAAQLDSSGTVTIDAGAQAADVIQVRVVDAHGNSGVAGL